MTIPISFMCFLCALCALGMSLGDYNENWDLFNLSSMAFGTCLFFLVVIGIFIL